MAHYKAIQDGTRGWLIQDDWGRGLRAGDGPAPGWHRAVGVRTQDKAEELATAMNTGRLTVGETDEGSPFIEGPSLDAWAAAQGWD